VHRRWFVQKTNAGYVSYLSGAASVSPTLAQILINRGIKTPGQVSAFLTQGLEDISDPFEIAGVGEALAAIEEARRSGAGVLVHGDYDVDGITATAIMVEALRSYGLDVRYYIPDRFQEGYGFSAGAVDRALQSGSGLIVTVDCGISSFEAAAYARKNGIGVIITDHHEPVLDPLTGRPLLPDALALINPKVTNPELSTLSGAGLAFKMAQALASREPRVCALDFLDMAALGTLADSVPLVGENRVIVKEGIARIQEGGRAGIKALKAVSGIEGRQIRAELLAFTLVPRMNAAGRLANATEVVELLLSAPGDRALEAASRLHGLNAERQKIEEEVFTEALEMLSAKGVGHAVVLGRPGWHEGVIGIVASRLAEKFFRPAFVLSIKGEVARGSARSIQAFDVHAGLAQCKDLLVSFGGHRQAAGLKLLTSNLEDFEKRICGVVAREVADFTPSIHIDADVRLRQINFKLVRELEMLEPFGFGNSAPVLGTKGLKAVEPRIVGNNHLKLKLRSRSQVMDAIGFDMGGLCGVVEDSQAVDAAYVATVNEWEGGRTLQLNLKALRPTAS
jgi:single-stranded-DNA-specific exonuclease